MNTGEKDSAPVVQPISSSELFGLIGGLGLFFFMVVVWGGYFLLGGLWPGPLKLWSFTALGVLGIASVFLSVRCGHMIARQDPPVRRVLSGLQAAGVVVIIVAEGIIGTWIVSSPPHLP